MSNESEITKVVGKTLLACFAFMAGAIALPALYNRASFAVQTQTKDGFTVNIRAKTDVFTTAYLARESEVNYARIEAQERVKSAMADVSLSDVARNACLYNKNDFSGTLLQEARGSSFANIGARDVDISQISFSEADQAILKADCPTLMR